MKKSGIGTLVAISLLPFTAYFYCTYDAVGVAMSHEIEKGSVNCGTLEFPRDLVKWEASQACQIKQLRARKPYFALDHGSVFPGYSVARIGHLNGSVVIIVPRGNAWYAPPTARKLISRFPQVVKPEGKPEKINYFPTVEIE